MLNDPNTYNNNIVLHSRCVWLYFWYTELVIQNSYSVYMLIGARRDRIGARCDREHEIND